MTYIEAFAAPVPESTRERYLAHAEKAAVLFKEYGALSVTECWGVDVPDGEVTSFPMAVKREDGEAVVFGWMVWPSRAVRDAAFEKLDGDERMKELFGSMPFDGKRLIFGGFEPILEL